MGWQKASGYNLRARVEAAMGRFKGVIGDGLRSRTDQRRATEVDVAVHALNRMLELGCPEFRPHRMTPERGWGDAPFPLIHSTRLLERIDGVVRIGLVRFDIDGGMGRRCCRRHSRQHDRHGFPLQWRQQRRRPRFGDRRHRGGATATWWRRSWGAAAPVAVAAREAPARPPSTTSPAPAAPPATP